MAAKAKKPAGEESIKHLSLYFLGGKEMRLEGLESLLFYKDIDKFSDADILTKVKALAKTYKQPKISVVTRTFYEEGELEDKKAGDLKDLKHTDAPLYPQADGAYTLFVPDLYRQKEGTSFEVLGLELDTESFTDDAVTEWETLEETEKLSEKRLMLRDKIRELNKILPTDDEIKTLESELPGLKNDRNALHQRYRNGLLDETVSAETLKQLLERRKLADAHIKEVQAQVTEYNEGFDTLETLRNSTPLGKEIMALTQELQEVYLRYTHESAHRAGLTDAGVETWVDEATQQDLANAQMWVELGKAQRTSGKVSRPMSREDRRAKEYRKEKITN